MVLVRPDIAKLARQTILTAGVDGVLPVPVSEIAKSASLISDDLYPDDPDMPEAMRSVMAKVKGNLLGLISFEERRYYVDKSVSTGRQRFTEAHEIGHDAMRWHRGAYAHGFGESDLTLAPDTRDELEVEANDFASELLFAGSVFSRRADQYVPSIEVPLSMTGEFDTSAHAAIRRYVQTSDRPLALLVLGRRLSPGSERCLWVNRNHSLSSVSFDKRYGPILGMVKNTVSASKYPVLDQALFSETGFLDETEMTFITTRGSVRFSAQTWSNGRLNFVLIFRGQKRSGPSIKLVDAQGRALIRR